MSCAISTHEYSNGFCFEKCQSGWTGKGSMCLQNCPDGFVDHGSACEAPSVIRQVAKAYLQPCTAGQIDRNGDCFEPKTFINDIQGPKSVGCGCVKKALKDRIQCPSGFLVYNNSCVSECPQGFKGIFDSLGNLTSMFCTEECPMSSNSKSRWTSAAQLCVKPVKKRLSQTNKSYSNDGRQSFASYEVPVTTLSILAKTPLGSSLNDRVRTAQTVGQSNAVGNNFFTESWKTLLNQPLLIIGIILGIFIFGYIGPTVFRSLSKLFQSISSSAGSLVESATTLVKGASGVASSGLGVVSSSLNQISQIQNVVAAKDAAAAAALH